MKQYLDVLRNIVLNGVRQPNRTGVDTLFIPGAMMQFDLTQGFPMVTTRKVPFKPIIGELLGFCRGVDNAKDFRALGAKIWDKNANEDGVDQAGNKVKNAWLSNPSRKGEDDLGRIYGVQWRGWRGEPSLKNVEAVGTDDTHTHFRAEVAYAPVDQLWNAIQTILNNPTSRRIIVNAWRPDELDDMALPPCHVMFQFLCDTKNNDLHMTMYQRSADFPVGIPFNIASYAMLLEIVAMMTGYTAKTFTHFMADTHIYVNQIDGVMEQLKREPMPLPTLSYTGPNLAKRTIHWGPDVFHQIEPFMFELVDYNPHPAITYPFNV